MDQISQLLLILVPASLVLFGMYITVQSFINGQKETTVLIGKNESKKVLLPLQLQAYERICLLLERISPQNLLVRLNGKALNVSDFQQVLITEIREEFNHNLSQQVYMSDFSWAQAKNAVEQTIAIINEAAIGLNPESNGIELSKNILKKIIESNQTSCETALFHIKAEARTEIFQ
ncbi:MAG: hypothetical protein V4683_14425 [Bacteroidota bacterium]